MEILLDGDPEALVGPVVSAAAAAKIAVVERDPTEKGDRRLLNFGHTLGHAIESACDYAGLRHGEAVGYGILFALRLALARGLDRRTAERIQAPDPPPGSAAAAAARSRDPAGRHGPRQEGPGVGARLGSSTHPRPGLDGRRRAG